MEIRPRVVSLEKDLDSSLGRFKKNNSDLDNRVRGLWGLSEKLLPWAVAVWASGIPSLKPHCGLTFGQVSTTPTMKKQVKVTITLKGVLTIS